MFLNNDFIFYIFSTKNPSFSKYNILRRQHLIFIISIVYCLISDNVDARHC